VRGIAAFSIASLVTISLVLLLLPIYACPEKISIKSPMVNQGMEARAIIILDSAPKGLAGYDMIVSLKSGEVADIVRVEFPEWAKLSDSSITDGSIRLKAVDLGDMVRPGATNIVLATIIFGNTKQGESLIELTVVRMDDDDGNPITPSIEPGRLMVMGPPTQTATTTQITAGATPPTITIYVSKTIRETITTTIERTVTITTSQTSQMTLFMILSIAAIFIAVIVLIISLTALRRKRTS
jgi:hypothetical protein